MILIAAAGAANFTIAQAGEIALSEHSNNYNAERINSLTAEINADVHLYALIPAVISISPNRKLSTYCGDYVAPSFAQNGLEAVLSIANGAGGNIQNSSFGTGDFYARPAWLDRAEKHWDLSLASGFYPPTGKYNMQNIALPVAANVTVESKDNVGLGFWKQHVRAGIAWYPMTNQTTAVTAVGSYEYDSDEKDFDVRPGQLFTVNWGVSQYLPLSKNRELLLEVGPAGCDTYQITDSTGGNALTDTPKSHIHAAGGQLGFIYVPWNAFLTFHSFYEFSASSNPQGASVGLNLGFKF